MFPSKYNLAFVVTVLGPLLVVAESPLLEDRIVKIKNRLETFHKLGEIFKKSRSELEDDDQQEDSSEDSDYGFQAWNYFGIAAGSLAILWILFWCCALFYIYVGCRCFTRRKFTTLSSQSASRSSDFHHSNYITFSDVTNLNIEHGGSPPPYEAITRDEPYEGGFTGQPVTNAVSRQQSMMLPSYTQAILDFNLETNV